MYLIDQLAENHILQAQERGEFDALPGTGKRLVLEDDSMVPEELRAGFRLLRNAGYLPPELQLHHDIHEVEQLLSCIQDADEHERVARRLRCLRLQLSHHRGDEIDFVIERRYQHKLLQKL